ncbi:hypothetical protein TNCV_3419011 [Trichonephila clavipes]|nr:hypothetical protein TNCV_3419011 [Trichonephila clavipes]
MENTSRMVCPIVLLKKFIAEDDDKWTCSPNYGRQRHLKFVHSSKNIIHADFDDENSFCFHIIRNEEP